MTNGGPQRSEIGTSGLQSKMADALIEVRPATPLQRTLLTATSRRLLAL